MDRENFDTIDTVMKYVSEALTGLCVNRFSHVDQALEDVRLSGESFIRQPWQIIEILKYIF